MGPIYWCAFLLLVSLTLFALEIFVPSGGTLGVLSVIASGAALVIAFRDGPLLGISTLAVIAVVGPGVFALAAKLWPHTPFGKRIIQSAPTPDEILPERQDLRALIGRRGVAVSRMIPGGVVEINGQSLDAVSVGEMVEPGDTIEVMRVEGRRLTVRKARISSDAPPLASDARDPHIADIAQAGPTGLTEATRAGGPTGQRGYGQRDAEPTNSPRKDPPSDPSLEDGPDPDLLSDLMDDLSS